MVQYHTVPIYVPMCRAFWAGGCWLSWFCVHEKFAGCFCRIRASLKTKNATSRNCNRLSLQVFLVLMNAIRHCQILMNLRDGIANLASKLSTLPRASRCVPGSSQNHDSSCRRTTALMHPGSIIYVWIAITIVLYSSNWNSTKLCACSNLLPRLYLETTTQTFACWGLVEVALADTSGIEWFGNGVWAAHTCFLF